MQIFFMPAQVISSALKLHQFRLLNSILYKRVKIYIFLHFIQLLALCLCRGMLCNESGAAVVVWQDRSFISADLLCKLYDVLLVVAYERSDNWLVCHGINNVQVL